FPNLTFPLHILPSALNPFTTLSVSLRKSTSPVFLFTFPRLCALLSFRGLTLAPGLLASLLAASRNSGTRIYGSLKNEKSCPSNSSGAPPSPKSATFDHPPSSESDSAASVEGGGARPVYDGKRGKT